MGAGKERNLKASQERYAPNKRSRCRALENCQSKESKQGKADLISISELIRDIRELGCRVDQIGKSAWTITPSEESRGSCLLISSEGGQRKKPSRYEGGSSRMGRSKKASRRSRNGTRSLGRNESSYFTDGRSAGMDNQVARRNQGVTRCDAIQPCGKSKSQRPGMCQASHSRRSESNLHHNTKGRGGI